MATKKSPVSKVKTAGKLPAGFSAVATGGGGAWHDFNESPILQGVVKTLGKFTGEYGIQRTMTVKNAKGVETTVSESGALKNLFNAVKKGKQVYIEFLGVVKLKGKKTYRAFSAGIK